MQPETTPSPSPAAISASMRAPRIDDYPLMSAHCKTRLPTAPDAGHGYSWSRIRRSGGMPTRTGSEAAVALIRFATLRCCDLHQHRFPAGLEHFPIGGVDRRIGCGLRNASSRAECTQPLSGEATGGVTYATSCRARSVLQSLDLMSRVLTASCYCHGTESRAQWSALRYLRRSRHQGLPRPVPLPARTARPRARCRQTRSRLRAERPASRR